MKRIVLASTSPRRRELLESTGIDFEICDNDYEEIFDPSLTPLELVKKFSRGKARKAAKNHINSIVIGADTIIAMDNQIFGKPHTQERAIKTLRELSGRDHEVITSITVIDTESLKEVTEIETTKIQFRKLTEEEIKSYAISGEALKKAGAYAIQGKAKNFIEKLEGDYSNVLGFPLTLLRKMLKKFDVNLPLKDI